MLAGRLVAAAVLLRAAARGGVALDLGLGRRVVDLGPQRVAVAAPRDVLFDVIAGPYRRTPRAMADKLEVIERAEGMVLAAHHTPVVAGLVVTTLETVTFDPPSRIGFRLVRGPVPHVVESFELSETADGCELLYSGEIGADLWALGAWWARTVARSWERSVAASLADARREAERRARRRV